MTQTEYAQRAARALLQSGAVGFSPEQPITFKSGLVSPVYVDNRRLPYFPDQWRVIIEGLNSLITAEALSFEVIAGVAVGGVPHSAALAYLTQSPYVFVRPEAKEHGTRRLVEGGEVAGRNVLLVEDLVTTGGSSLSAVHILREEKATLTDVLAIVAYGFAEASAAFSAAHVRLHTLTNFETILHEALQMGKLTTDQVAFIRVWFDDPHNWTGKNR